MPVISVPVMLNYPPYFWTVSLDPVDATVAGLISDVAVRMDLVQPSAIKLRWIVDKDSAFPYPPHVPQPIAWYAAKGHCLVSTPIEQDEALREKLRDIENSPLDVVQLYAIGLPQEIFGVTRFAYVQKLSSGSGLEILVRTTASNPNPSAAGKDRSVHDRAQLKVPMYDGRRLLADNLGPNVAIYVPPFAEMWHALHDEQKLSQIEVDLEFEDIVEELRRDLASIDVKDETDYLDVVAKHLPKLLPPGCRFHKKYQYPLQRSDKRQLELDLDFVVTCSTPYGEEAVVVVGEAKFREGNEGSGPTQALYGYRRACILARNAPIFFSTCCPCLIVAAAGHLLHVEAAVFTDAVYCTEMTVESLSVKRGATNVSKMRLARCFQLLQNTVEKLAQFYEENHAGTMLGLDHLLPAPCFAPQAGGAGACVPFKGPNFSLKFKDTVFTNEGRAIFKGEITFTKPLHDAPSTPSTSQLLPNISSTIPSTKSVYVKFVDRYGEKVHRFLAEEGFAPELQWFGEVVGGAFMAVMDEVEGRTVQDYLNHKDILSEADLEALDRALERLRAENLVHGALLPQSVVMSPNAEGTKTAFLIDFDWAGKAGEAQHPDQQLNPYLWPVKHDMRNVPVEHSDDVMRSMLLNQPSSQTMLSRASPK